MTVKVVVKTVPPGSRLWDCGYAAWTSPTPGNL